MELVPGIFAATLVVLTIVLTVVGIQMLLVLLELRKTLRKVNETLDTADKKLASITAPLHNLVGIVANVGTGMKVFEAFLGWLQRHDEEKRK